MNTFIESELINCLKNKNVKKEILKGVGFKPSKKDLEIMKKVYTDKNFKLGDISIPTYFRPNQYQYQDKKYVSSGIQTVKEKILSEPLKCPSDFKKDLFFIEVCESFINDDWSLTIQIDKDINLTSRCSTLIKNKSTDLFLTNGKVSKKFSYPALHLDTFKTIEYLKKKRDQLS